MKPGAAVSTAEVYRRLQPAVHGTRFTAELRQLLQQGRGLPELAGVLGNVLETVTEALVPEVVLWKERLLAQGAHGALMSGSGPSVVGIFSAPDRALGFQERFAGQAEIFVVELTDVGVEEIDGGDR